MVSVYTCVPPDRFVPKFYEKQLTFEELMNNDFDEDDDMSAKFKSKSKKKSKLLKEHNSSKFIMQSSTFKVWDDRIVII